MEQRELRQEINRAFLIVAAIAVAAFMAWAAYSAAEDDARTEQARLESERRTHDLSEEVDRLIQYGR